MNRKPRRLLALSVGVCLILLIGSVSSSTARDRVDLEILAGPVNSWLATGASEILNKNHPWIRTSVTETTGSSATIALGAKKDPTKVLIAPAEEAYVMAKAGALPATPGDTYPNLRWICAWTVAGASWLTFDQNIKTMSDFAGKRVGAMEEADASTKNLIASLEILGIRDKVKVEYLDFGALQDALRDGLVDVVLGWSELYEGGKWEPVFPMRELLSIRGKKLYSVSWDAGLLKKAYDKTGYVFGIGQIAPGAWGEAQTEPVDGLVIMSIGLGCYAGADEEVIYEVTKMIAAHYGELRNAFPAASVVTRESLLSRLPPIVTEKDIHPGALKYYKEAGIYPAAFEGRSK
jgi:TRAP transporter TAXI family solute receptor